MRILAFILPLFALAVSQVASAPILRTTTEREYSLINDASGALKRRNTSPDYIYSPMSVPSSRSSTHPTSPMLRRHVTSPVMPGSYRDRRLLRRSGQRVGSGLEKGTLATHVERRWWLFDKIKQGFQNFGKKVKEGFTNAAKKIKEGVQTAVSRVGNFVKNAANKVKEGIQHVAGKVKGAFQKVGNFVKNAANKVKEGIQHAAGKVKEGFQKFGEKVKYAAGKVKEGLVKAGHWIKDNAGKVAKFGLKIWSTAASVVGRVAGFIPIPGVGKAIGKAIGGISKVADIVAEKIPGDLGDKLNKGWKVMSTIQNPLGTLVKGTAGKIADILLKRD